MCVLTPGNWNIPDITVYTKGFVSEFCCHTFFVSNHAYSDNTNPGLLVMKRNIYIQQLLSSILYSLHTNVMSYSKDNTDLRCLVRIWCYSLLFNSG